MKNFKEMLDKDLDSTFYNTGEFAEVKRIKYDGAVKNIPVIFDFGEMKSRNTAADHAEGMVQDITVVRAKLSDFGKEPRQGARIWIDGELYKIEDGRTEYNELILSLERFDE
jgi:hypothetical protein